MDKRKADEEILTREYILKNCVTKLVSAEMNAEDLESTIHRRLCDLAEIVVVNAKIAGREALITMGKWMLEASGAGEQELFEAAHRNMERDARIMELGEALGHSTRGETLYVLTNSNCVYGAALIACPEVLKACREVLGEDVYVIPSSVHEVLLYRKGSGGDTDELTGLIGVVNNSGIMGPEDILSNHLYGFDENGKLYIVK